jgi:hypothetical protein
VFRRNKNLFLNRSFAEWPDLMQELKKQVSELKVDGITSQETIAELSRQFGPVSHLANY